MQYAVPNCKVITIEYEREIAEHTAKIHRNFQVPKIEIIHSKFDDYLEILSPNVTVDLILVNGKHHEIPTIQYFEKLKKHITDRSIIIFENINWSMGMVNAWNTIKTDSSVKLSVETFDYGIVFFNNDMKEKLNLVLIPTLFKPLNIGLFG
jgi:predicted O-methyltransferase YrrM